jgi:hypothetical protein
MPTRIPLSLFLLVGVLFTGVPAKAAITTVSASPEQAIAQQGIAETLGKIAVEQPTSTAATLTLKDLPPGFTELPPELSSVLSSRLEVLTQQLGQANLKPENFFAFVDPQDFQIILGFTSQLPNQPEQASFDTSVQQLQQPEVQQRMMSRLQESIKSMGPIKVTEYKTLPGLNDVANASTGITMGLEAQGQPLRLDFATFRRNSVGAFTAVMYPNGAQPKLAVGEVARKLDGRIVQVSADTKASTSASAAQ